MKKIVPFTKDILFNTDIFEINSISLEHNVNVNNDNNIIGEFIISGDYKESDSSLNLEPFIYNVPFDIDLNGKYNSDKAKVEIDDFNYEVIKNNTLEVNINLCIDGIEVEEITEEPLIDIIDENIEELKVDEKVDLEERNSIVSLEKLNEQKEEVTSIFNNFSDKDDTYVTYHVHIYRENDTIDNIIKLYKSSKEELEEYNDLSRITLGSKIIIPNNA